jgi:hypothetical protein
LATLDIIEAVDRDVRHPECRQEALLGWEMEGKFSMEVEAVAQQR